LDIINWPKEKFTREEFEALMKKLDFVQHYSSGAVRRKIAQERREHLGFYANTGLWPDNSNPEAWGNKALDAGHFAGINTEEKYINRQDELYNATEKYTDDGHVYNLFGKGLSLADFEEIMMCALEYEVCHEAKVAFKSNKKLSQSRFTNPPELPEL